MVKLKENYQGTY